MKILLVCEAGVSTSFLVLKIQKAAIEMDIDVEIAALPMSSAEKEINNWDVCLLGPHVKQYYNKLKELSNGTPIVLVNSADYGLLNGDNILVAALDAVEKAK